MFSIRIDNQNPIHVSVTVFANGASIGQLRLRVEEFNEFQARLLDVPWHKQAYRYDWDDDVSGDIPDSLKAEATNAPWNTRHNQGG